MSLVGGAMLALTAVKAVSQWSMGGVREAEAEYSAGVAEYNAALYEGKADIIDVQKSIDKVRYERLKRSSFGTSVANVAGAGIELQGSALAVILDTQKQIGIDQLIGQAEFEKEKLYTKYEAMGFRSEADMARMRGRYSRQTARSNAYSTLLTGGTQAAIYSGFDFNLFRKKES